MTTVQYLNGRRYLNPVLAAERENGMANTRRRITNGEQTLARAENLIAQRPAIEREIASLNRVADFATQLKDSHSLHFRFFMLVDGQEVTLVVSR